MTMHVRPPDRHSPTSFQHADKAGPGPDTVPAPKTLVLGLGNLILRDDGAGILAAREVARRLGGGRDDVVIHEASVAGFGLLDFLAGFERAFIIDAIQTRGGRPGTVYRFRPEALPGSARLGCAHEVNLPTALNLGRMLDIDMALDVVIYAIEAADVGTFGETVSPEVESGIQAAAARVIDEIEAQTPIF